MRKPDPLPPEWFKPEGPPYLARTTIIDSGEFDPHEARAWLKALQRCHALRLCHGAKLSAGVGAEAPKGLFSVEEAEDGYPVTNTDYLGLPPLRAITAAEANGPEYRRASFGRVVFLALNLDAPDPVLERGFARELAKARRTLPDRSPVPSGPRAANRQFSAKVFDDWRNQRIVQVAEIDWWAKKHPSNHVTDAVRARWIWPKLRPDDQPNVKIKRARKALDRAIQGTTALWAQIVENEPETLQ